MITPRCHLITFKNESGFSMVEVLMAMAIFAIGFLGVSTLVIATTKNNTTSNIMTQASMLAREKVEHLKALPLTDLEDACSDDIEPEVLHKIYKRDCEVATLSSTMKSIEVRVRWKRRGQNRSVVLETTTRGYGK